jgi:hypothetical protein
MEDLRDFLERPDDPGGTVTLSEKQRQRALNDIRQAQAQAETHARIMMAEKDREIAGLVEELTRERMAAARVAEALAHLVLKE